MYNRTNGYMTYNRSTVYFDWFQIDVKGRKSVVVKERSTTGTSLTNSIEDAIQVLYNIFKYQIAVYQDCGEEGIFHVDYEGDLGLNSDGREFLVVETVNWHKFSNSLETMELLYAKA